MNVNHAFLYTNGKIQDLGTLGGYISIGQAINDAGEIVGESSFTTAFHTVDAFIYENGQMQDLNDLIDPALKITLTSATGINSSGQIVANAGNSAAYLLTPVPEPGTCWMLAAAALVMYLGRLVPKLGERCKLWTRTERNHNRLLHTPSEQSVIRVTTIRICE